MLNIQSSRSKCFSKKLKPEQTNGFLWKNGEDCKETNKITASIVSSFPHRRRNMLFKYIQKALKKAHYKMLDDGTWFAEIPGFEGVWANAKTVEECRNELQEVLEEWLVLKIRDRDPIPAVEGVEIRVKEAAAILI